MQENINNIILLGENVNTELKEANNGLPKNIFETVCAFLNTTGGFLILGVNDKKEIKKIKKELIEKIKKIILHNVIIKILLIQLFYLNYMK